MSSIYEEINKAHGLSPTQEKIIELVGKGKKVLEIGSSSGYMTKQFLANKCRIDVVEIDKESADRVSKMKVKVVKGSIEDPKVIQKLDKDYDFIILADVLEHLIDPEKTLRKFHRFFKNPKIIISMGNIASWPMRKQLFFRGDFKYQASGLLDKTHLHFYTPTTLSETISSSGYSIKQVIGTVSYLPFERSLKKTPVLGATLISVIYHLLKNKYKNLAYYHFLILAEKDGK